VYDDALPQAGIPDELRVSSNQSENLVPAPRVIELSSSTGAGVCDFVEWLQQSIRGQRHLEPGPPVP